MSGVVLNGHGGFDMLEWRDDLAVPTLAATDVLIKVGAAGVNNTDINTRLAWYSKSDGASEDASWGGEPLSLPRIQGIDVCGEIVAHGNQVDASRLGERVLVEPCYHYQDGEKRASPGFVGSECDGGFSQFMKIDQRHAYALRSDLSDAELASFPCSHSTAENMLHRTQLSKNETVLITGASGGVGSAAVQLAQLRGATVIAVCGENKRERLCSLGARQTLVRGESILKALGENAVDVCIDLVGGDSWPELLGALKPGGRYAVAGAIAGPIVPLDLRTLYLKDQSFFGCTVLDEPVFGNLVGYIERGDIKPLVERCFALQDIQHAQEVFLTKQYVGKLVLKVPQ